MKKLLMSILLFFVTLTVIGQSCEPLYFFTAPGPINIILYGTSRDNGRFAALNDEVVRSSYGRNFIVGQSINAPWPYWNPSLAVEQFILLDSNTVAIGSSQAYNYNTFYHYFFHAVGAGDGFSIKEYCCSYLN
jgi:hypothetical protein